MKFLIDMPLSPDLVQWLQHRGHDAVHAAALGLDRAPDTTIIARALLDSRTIVTADLDYPRLLAITQATAPSLILFRDGEWSEADVRERFGAVLAASPRTTSAIALSSSSEIESVAEGCR